MGLETHLTSASQTAYQTRLKFRVRPTVVSKVDCISMWVPKLFLNSIAFESETQQQNRQDQMRPHQSLQNHSTPHRPHQTAQHHTRPYETTDQTVDQTTPNHTKPQHIGPDHVRKQQTTANHKQQATARQRTTTNRSR